MLPDLLRDAAKWKAKAFEVRTTNPEFAKKLAAAAAAAETKARAMAAPGGGGGGGGGAHSPTGQPKPGGSGSSAGGAGAGAGRGRVQQPAGAAATAGAAGAGADPLHAEMERLKRLALKCKHDGDMQGARAALARYKELAGVAGGAGGAGAGGAGATDPARRPEYQRIVRASWDALTASARVSRAMRHAGCGAGGVH